MNSKEKLLKAEAIAKLISLAKNEKEIVSLFDDLLTETEIDKIHERVKILECLNNGLSQRATLSKTGAAIATVGRGAKVLQKETFKITSFINKGKNTKWWHQLFWCV